MRNFVLYFNELYVPNSNKLITTLNVQMSATYDFVLTHDNGIVDAEVYFECGIACLIAVILTNSALFQFLLF